MLHIFVYNPASGKVDCREELCRKAAAYTNGEAVFHVTTARVEATSFVRAFCESHPEEPLRFYACGGDGTINEVVSGAAGFANAAVYPYPCGSGNDFVKYYGKAEDFLALPEEPVDLPADLMRVGDRLAVNVVNFGFDTAVCRTMERVKRKKLIGGKRAYTTGVVTSLISAMRHRCRVTVDGEPIGDELLLCTVANGRYVGGQFCCAPRSDNTDGLLEVCLVKPVSRLTFVKLVGAYRDGRHLDDPRFAKHIVYRRGKRVEVEAEDGFAFCLDGEIIAANRFTIESVPAGVTICVPASLATHKEECPV